MPRFNAGQETESSSKPLPGSSKWRARVNVILTRVAKVLCFSSEEDLEAARDEETETLLTGPRPEIGSETSAQWRTQRPPRSNDLEHRIFAVNRSNIAPASSGYVFPIATASRMQTSMARDTVAFGSNGGDDRSKKEHVWKRTIHVHLDGARDEETEPCRCLLDTGSDVNLVSQATLRDLQYPFAKLGEPDGRVLTGIGGIQVLPIGSVVLTWHMDGLKGNKYDDVFWVISDETPALFDVLIGNDWIHEYGALQRNPAVMFLRRLGWR